MARLDELAAIEAAVWHEVDTAVRDKSHAWHVGVLATTDGECADARNVVLREWDTTQRLLRVYTDARSAKVAQLARHPRGTVVLWSEALGWQLRLRVQISARTAGLAVSSRWARLKMTPAAHDYLSPLSPGSPRDAAAPLRETRQHFALLSATVLSADWLELHPEGHRRAQFDRQGARWLTP